MRPPTSGKRSSAAALFALLGVVLCLSTGLAGAVRPEQADREEAGAGKDDKLTTVTYGVADLVQNSAAWRQGVAHFVKARPDGIEGLARVIIQSIGPEIWEGVREGTSTLRELDGAKLEITTTAAKHAQISELLKALRRLTEVSVTLEADWFEVPRAFYRKEIEPALAKGPAAVEEDMALKIRKQGVHLRFSKPTILHEQDTCLSLRNALVYVARPGDPKRRPDEVFGTVFQGVSFQVKATIAGDRR